MSITTILPPVRDASLPRTMEDVLTCLKRQPGIPVDLRRVADSIAGLNVAQVEKAVLKLEGPTPGPAKEAYIHFCRVNNQAVFIP